MKRLFWAASALALLANPLQAGGLDRTYLPIDIIFETGNVARLSFARVISDVSGDGSGVTAVGAIPAGTSYSDVGGNFNLPGLALKYDVTDRFSAALMFERPFGSDIRYNGDPNTTELGGTTAIAETNMLSLLLRYKITDRVSVHGGVRVSQASGDIDLRGLAYGPGATLVPPGTPFGAAGFNGYSVSLDTDTALGYTLGAAYERPDIALRVALTYNSKIVHKFDTEESFNGASLGASDETEVELPQSVALDFQTGIAPNTLIFGQIRWAEWSAFKIDPTVFTAASGVGLVELEDWWTYTLGIGRRFSDSFAARASVIYEQEADPVRSPLSPVNGFWAVSLGGAYDVNEQVTISGGFRYTWFGDAEPETGTPDVVRGVFEDNTASSFGLQVAYRF